MVHFKSLFLFKCKSTQMFIPQERVEECSFKCPCNALSIILKCMFNVTYIYKSLGIRRRLIII